MSPPAVHAVGGGGAAQLGPHEAVEGSGQRVAVVGRAARAAVLQVQLQVRRRREVLQDELLGRLAVPAVRGLHSSTSQLNLSRV